MNTETVLERQVEEKLVEKTRQMWKLCCVKDKAQLAVGLYDTKLLECLEEEEKKMLQTARNYYQSISETSEQDFENFLGDFLDIMNHDKTFSVLLQKLEQERQATLSELIDPDKVWDFSYF